MTGPMNREETRRTRMQNIETNALELADSLEALRERIPEEDRGPTFEVGEVFQLENYLYSLGRISEEGVLFVPHGKVPRKFKKRRGNNRR